MSEFQDKLQLMKNGIKEDINNNPALISSEDASNEENNFSQLNPDNFMEEVEPSPVQIQRNERGRRQRKSIKDRLEAVIADNRAKDIQNQQLSSYIAEQERQLAEAQARAEQNAHYSNVYYEQSLENDEQRVLSELESAKESGDTKREVELHKRLADIAAQRQTQLLSKTFQKNQSVNYPRPEFYQEPQHYPYLNQEAYQEPINEHYDDFLDENPWADPNSSEYDVDLSNEVNSIALELNKHLKFSKRSDIIGTQDYYNTLSNLMSERYGGSANRNDNEYKEHRGYDYDVAPVSKRGSSMADRYIANRQNNNRPQRGAIALTPDQEEVAIGMIPVLSHIHRRPFTVEEAKAEYYDQMMKMRRERPGF